MAGQPWRAVPGGWVVEGEHWGWSFELRVEDNGLRVLARIARDGVSADWLVPTI